MTKSFEHFDRDLCDKLFDFICPDENRMSDKEIEAELQRLGIDVRPAWEKIQMALAHAQQAERAKSELETAKKRRPSVLDKLRDYKVSSIPDIQELKKWIEDRLNAPTKAAFYRKLEHSSDNDLKSLLEDLSLLEEFSKDTNNAEP